jgi:cytochrome b561
MNVPGSSAIRFTLVARVLHWLMAAMILAMLFIGVGMVATVSERYDQLFALHKPLGVAVLALAALRLLWRLFHRPPPLPADLPRPQALAAKASHLLLYALMFALPLIGWATLSSGGYPASLGGGWVLPPLLAADPQWHAWLRPLHRWLAYLLFATVLLHFAAALYHGLVRRDGVLASMLGAEPRGDR